MIPRTTPTEGVCNMNQPDNFKNATRCQHTKLNGSPCAAPARHGRNYCVFHDAEHAKQPDSALRMVEDAMSLQYALFQVMRLLTDKAVDTKRVALMLYALQIASSNLKRLHEETRETTNAAGMANDKSLMKEFLEVLQIPETEYERMAEESAAEMERENAPPDTFTIKACASDACSLEPKALPYASTEHAAVISSRMRRAAAAGSGEAVIGRPTTIWLAPAVMASVGVAARSWSCWAVPAGRMPGVTMVKPAPSSRRISRTSRAEVTTPSQPAVRARAARRRA